MNGCRHVFVPAASLAALALLATPPATRAQKVACMVHPGLPEHMGAWRYGPGAAEWLVEVVDMEAGTVIVSRVLDVGPPPQAFFFAPGWLAVYDDEDILPKYRMWRLELTGLP